MREWLGVKQLTKETGIHENTIRRYLSTFSQFFSYTGGRRSRRYESSAVGVLNRIRGLYNEGFETPEVAKVLSEEFPVLLDAEQFEDRPASEGLPAVVPAEEVTELKETLKKQIEFSRLLLDSHNEQKALMEQLLKDNEEQRKFNESLVKALSDQGQQEVHNKILEELVEMKQRDQLLLSKLEESEAAAPVEEKKGGFLQIFRRK